MIRLIEKIGSLYNEIEKGIIKLMGQNKEVDFIDYNNYICNDKNLLFCKDSKIYLLSRIMKEKNTFGFEEREYLIFKFYSTENSHIKEFNFNLRDLPFDALFLIMVCKRLKEIV